ncbi:MAG TPA: autotransporter-associated beta strand repeat-containing protein [Kiritimatiellia bacterium]|nr:autotransporter-associated beta strand repeat-containing protein [Kiritimatiellia bacterium]HPS08260.1 autotransporter-associated beta strand repeat-containing protein [Kiritimatiellia bacterium]
MKPSRVIHRVKVSVLLTLIAVCVRGETYTWDADAAMAGAQDGAGAWGVSGTTWWDGVTNKVWQDGNDALIGSGGGAAGTVTIMDRDVKPASLTFNAAASGAYSVDASGPYRIDLNGASRRVTVNADSATLACGVTNGALAKFGSGTLALTGPCTLNGLQVNGGNLAVFSNLTVAASGGVVYLGNASTAYSGTLTINTGATVTITGTISDSVVLGRDGGSGAVVQNGGVFRVGMTGSSFNVGASGNSKTFARYALSGGTLDLVNHPLNVALYGGSAFTGMVEQSGGVITNAAGLSLGNGIAFGGYTLTGGSIFLGSGGIAGATGRHEVVLGGGTVGASTSWSSSANMELTCQNGATVFDTATNTVTLNGLLSGAGGFVKRGAGGTLGLTNANSFGGGTLVSAGTLAIYHGLALGAGPVTVTGGGTNKLFLNGGIALTNALTLGSEKPAYSDVLRSVSSVNIIGGPLTVYESSIRSEGGSTLRITNGIAGTSYVSFNAGGTIRVEGRPICLTNQAVYFGGGSAGIFQLNVGGNVFSTASLWGGMTLALGLADALPTNVNLFANNSAGGKLNLNGFDQTIGKLSQNSTYPLTVTNSGALATFTVNQSDGTVFAGRLTGNLRLVKKGAGTLTLTNANTFTGGAVVSNGTLRLAMANALPSAGAVGVSGGIYDLGGFAVTNGAVTVRGGEVVNGTLYGNPVELAGTGTVRVALGGSGGLIKSGDGTSEIVEALSYSGTTTVEGGTLRLQPLPNGTVAYYGFDDSSDLGRDSSAMSNTLKTLTGAPQHAANGRFGGALYLNGASTLGTLSGQFPTGVPTGAAPYTVAAYIKADAGCSFQGGWIGYGFTDTGRCNNFRLDGNTNYVGVWNYWWANDMGATMPSGSFTDGWHSVVGTWDGATERLYIDGVQRNSRTTTGLNVGPNQFVIGRTIGDAHFKGWVDEVLIANRALSAAEITSLHSTGAYHSVWIPSGTSLDVAAGAVMDLNQSAQCVARLSGEGCVTGGLLTVTGCLSPGDAEGETGTLSVAGGLTLASGVTNVFDCAETTADAVRVSGPLTLAGPATLRVVLPQTLPKPYRADVFTFGALVGNEALSLWTVEGCPKGYCARLTAGPTAITLSIVRVGTLVTVK